MKAFIFDTETSGLINNRTVKIDRQPEIIEFFGQLVDLNTGEVLDKYGTLIRPANPISAEITKITHITNEMLADAPAFARVAGSIHKALCSGDAVIAHNLSFDMEMVDIEFERLGTPIKWPMGICTVEQTTHIKGFRLTLSNLYSMLFDEAFPDAHRAEPDVQALTRVVLELRKRELI